MTGSCDDIPAYLMKHNMEVHDWIMWWHSCIPYEAQHGGPWLDHVMTFLHTLWSATWRSHDWICDDIPAYLMKHNMEVHDWIMWPLRGHMIRSCDKFSAYLMKRTIERSHDWSCNDIPAYIMKHTMEVTWLDHVMMERSHDWIMWW